MNDWALQNHAQIETIRLSIIGLCPSILGGWGGLCICWLFYVGGYKPNWGSLSSLLGFGQMQTGPHVTFSNRKGVIQVVPFGTCCIKIRCGRDGLMEGKAESFCNQISNLWVFIKGRALCPCMWTRTSWCNLSINDETVELWEICRSIDMKPFYLVQTVIKF